MGGIVLHSIEKEFNGITVFKNVNLDGIKGKVIAIKGKSGVGKSTLLNIIAGLEKPTSGTYYYNDINMSEKNLNGLTKIRNIYMGYISQHSPMIPNLSVIENILVPLWFEKNKNKKAEYAEQIEFLSELFEIRHLLNKKIGMLSGGEIQRVGVIRALIKNPELIIADEPTGALDDETAFIILKFFNELKSAGKTVILATHSGTVANYCDEVYHLTKNGLSLTPV